MPSTQKGHALNSSGTAARRRWPWKNGTTSSWTPWITSVGHRTFAARFSLLNMSPTAPRSRPFRSATTRYTLRKGLWSISAPTGLPARAVLAAR